MNLPYLGISIENSSNLLITHQHNDRARALEVSIPLVDLNKRGFDDSAHAVGTLVLRLMRRWYPEAFQMAPNLAAPNDSEMPNECDDHGLVAALIEKSLLERSSAYLGTLDHLIGRLREKEHDPQTKVTIDTWPSMRDHISRF